MIFLWNAEVQSLFEWLFCGSGAVVFFKMHIGMNNHYAIMKGYSVFIDR